MAALRCISQKFSINGLKKSGRLHVNIPCAVCIRYINYSAVEYDESRNPAPLFFSEKVQSLLKNLTRVELKKVYKKRKLGGKGLADPVYKFMTDEELQESLNEARRKVNKMLQIPPAVPVRKPKTRILSQDPTLQGLETCRMVFTDITFGVKDCERLIVVREPDGTLKEAEWELRDRMNQLYFPQKGRVLRPPRLFEDTYLNNLLEKQEYEFVLDSACIQFEPNDSKYQRIVSITYQHLNDNNRFDALRSTRHFGALTFFLVWNKNIDNLLLDLIETSYIEEANDLIKLYSGINDIPLKCETPLEAIEDYIEKYCNKKPSLQLAIQAYKDLVKQKEELEKNIKAAHGVS